MSGFLSFAALVFGFIILLSQLVIFLLSSSKNCTNFRKLFPEYVAMYNEQQNSVQPIPHQHMQDNGSSNLVEQVAQQFIADKKPTKAATQKGQRKQLPLWMLLFLISIFGAIMSLPLMQL